MTKNTNSDKVKNFDAVLKALNSSIKSESGGNLIAKLGEKPIISVETISTGSLVLDSKLGGGFPKGRIIEIFGPEASGKTSIALTAIGNVQKNGGLAAFIDFENALDPKYAKKLGVDIPNLALAQPDYAEQGLELVQQLAESKAVDIIVVDSVAALVPKIEFEGNLEDQNMATVARLLSRALKKLVKTANASGTTIIFINQIREKVGFVMGNPEITPGGKALKFFASQRIDIRRKGQIKDDKDTKRIIGNEIRFKIVKNKIAPPFEEGTTILTFSKGINKRAELIEVGPEYGVIDKPNPRSYFIGGTDERLGTSKAEALRTLEENPDIYEKLSKQLVKAIEEHLHGDNDDWDEKTEEQEEQVEQED